MFGVLFAFLGRFMEVLSLLFAGGILTLSGYPSPFVTLFFIVDTLVVGLAEEGVFRGYIQRHLTHSYGFIPALLFSSILFKIYHVNFFKVTFSDLPSLFFIVPSFGVFAAYFYYRAGENLLGPVMLHMFYDLFGTIVPLEAETIHVSAELLFLLRIFQWSILMLTLKILADRNHLFLEENRALLFM